MKFLLSILISLASLPAFALGNFGGGGNLTQPFVLLMPGYGGAAQYGDGQSLMLVGHQDGNGNFSSQQVDPEGFFGDTMLGTNSDLQHFTLVSDSPNGAEFAGQSTRFSGGIFQIPISYGGGSTLLVSNGFAWINTSILSNSAAGYTGDFWLNQAGDTNYPTLLIHVHKSVESDFFYGDGGNLTGLNGTNLLSGTVNSNAFDADTLALLGGGGSPGGTMNFDNGNITSDGSGNITANGVNAPGDFTGNEGGNYYLNPAGGLFHVTSGGTTRIIADTTGNYSVFNFYANGAETGAFYSDAGGGHIIFEAAPGRDFTFNTSGANNRMIISTAGNVGVGNMTPAYLLDVSGTMGDSQSGLWNYDGSGNFTAQSFNPVSDRQRKENIQLFQPSNALAMALALTNYTWRFKARTNTFAQVSQTVSTNLVSIGTNAVSRRFSTNTVTRVFPAGGKEFGCMAQDWRQVTGTGTGTNISLTAMNGLLLGAVQALGGGAAKGITTAEGVTFYAHGITNIYWTTNQ